MTYLDLYMKLNEMRKLTPAKMLDPAVFVDFEWQTRAVHHTEYNDGSVKAWSDCDFTIGFGQLLLMEI